jgi:hypothetical protein
VGWPNILKEIIEMKEFFQQTKVCWNCQSKWPRERDIRAKTSLSSILHQQCSDAFARLTLLDVQFSLAILYPCSMMQITLSDDTSDMPALPHDNITLPTS